MITKIKIENFRSIVDLEIDEMKRLTLISGRNNCGKSTILEALFLLMDHGSPNSFFRINSFRGMDRPSSAFFWKPLFHNLDTDKAIAISVYEDDLYSTLEYKKDENYSLPVNVTGVSDELLAQFRNGNDEANVLSYTFKQKGYSEDGHFISNGVNVLRDAHSSLPGNEFKKLMSTSCLNDLLSRQSDTILDEIGHLELIGEKNQVISVLKLIDPQIEDLVTLSIQGNTQLYTKKQGHLIPLQYAGDGIVKILNICLAIINNPHGLVLIDEIESGFHYSVYDQLWHMIDALSKEKDCQVIATTHSYEMITSAVEGITNKDDFAYYRIGHNKNQMKAFRFAYDNLVNAIDSQMEVR